MYLRRWAEGYFRRSPHGAWRSFHNSQWYWGSRRDASRQWSLYNLICAEMENVSQPAKSQKFSHASHKSAEMRSRNAMHMVVNKRWIWEKGKIKTIMLITKEKCCDWMHVWGIRNQNGFGNEFYPVGWEVDSFLRSLHASVWWRQTSRCPQSGFVVSSRWPHLHVVSSNKMGK